ncbi:alcohol acetyltransferase [Favolaschia claudopus]|uniref:Alcohol acetyltransferase n=1 Tax=Favolaschia claudopus TaxID=2862362 RepID=A0AAW0CK38_9AGAR
MAATNPKSLRAAGLLESWHITRHLLGMDSCVIISARYVCTNGSSLNKEHLFSALQELIDMHPILCVMVRNEDSKPSFVKLETIDLSSVVHFSASNDLEAAIQRQLSTRFDTSTQLPLWRVEVLNDNTVILAYHHGIGDGLSGVAFHRLLLLALEEGNTASSAEVTVPELISLLPPIEAVTNLRPSIFKIISAVLSLFLPASWKRSYYVWSANPVSKTADFTARVKLMTFSPENMAVFAKICRSHKATITSAVYVLACAVLSRLVPAHSPAYRTLCATVAISLRGVAGGSEDAFCDYVAAHTSYPPIHPGFQWSVAANYATELQRQKSSCREEIGMISLVANNIGGFMKGMLGNKRNATFEISNAGRVAGISAGRQWAIERMAFAQSDLVLGPALKINAIGDPTGALNITLTWGDAAIDKEVVESFATQFEEGFRALLV